MAKDGQIHYRCVNALSPGPLLASCRQGRGSHRIDAPEIKMVSRTL